MRGTMSDDRHIHRFNAQFERGQPVDVPEVPTVPELSDQLISAYRKAWSARYGVNPKPIEPKERVEVFNFLALNYSTAQCDKLINTFLEMNDPKFLDDAHSPLRLRWGLQKVLAEIGKRKTKQTAPPKIQIEYWCGRCHDYFRHVPSDNPICPNCT